MFVSFGIASDHDLVADVGRDPGRVQVKTATRFCHRGWTLPLATRGGNSRGLGVAKAFWRERCDHLFAVVGDGRRWFIPARAITATHGIVLGSTTWGEDEVDPREASRASPLATLRDPRRGSEVVKRSGL